MFAANFHLFRGTPSCAVAEPRVREGVRLQGARSRPTTADHYFDVIGEKLAHDAFRPRALFERFNIEVLATTESPIDTLDHHHKPFATAAGRAA